MIRARRRAEARLARRRAAGVGAAAAAAGLIAASPATGATIQVTNNNGSGDGSLLNASFQANNNPGADTITFAANVRGTIRPGQTLNFKYETTVAGPGRSELTVENAGTGPTITTQELSSDPVAPVDLTVEGLTVSGPTRGAMHFEERYGSVTIRDSTITGLNPGEGGGAIYASGLDSLTVENSLITGSEAEDGGGIYMRDVATTVSGTTFFDNRADQDGGAIAVFETSDPRDSTLTVQGSSFDRSVAYSHGGAISVAVADGPTKIERSTISGSFTPGLGAGVYFGYGDDLTVDSTTMFENGSNGTRGGALFVFAPRGRFELRNSTLTDNPANRGGALYWTNYYDNEGVIRNSTIAENYAVNSGGGIYRYGYDGVVGGFEGPDNLVISSSIVAANDAPYDPDIAEHPDAQGSFILDHSLIGVRGAGTAITDSAPGTNKIGAGDPGLGPLADNGGPTRTMLPSAGSPALDAGISNGLATDQRGLDRTADQPVADMADGADIGAAELPDSQLVGGDATAKAKQKQRGRKIAVSVQAVSAEAGDAAAAGSVKVGKKRVGLGPVSSPLAPGSAATLTMRPSKRGAKKIARLLAKGRKAKASVSVTIADQAGNATTEDLRVTLTGKKRGKKKGK